MKTCTECGSVKSDDEFYDKYARCKQCVREDTNAANWYKEAELLPFEQWPEPLRQYTITRHQYVEQGGSVPAKTRHMITAYILAHDDALSTEPSEATLPVVVALHRQVKALSARCDKLEEELEDLKQAAVDHGQRTIAGELKNLSRKLASDLDTLVRDQVIDTMDAADVKEGVRLLNQAVLQRRPLPAAGILNSVLTLAQLQLEPPEPFEELYTKYYSLALTPANAADIDRVQEIAGVNLYNYDWIKFLHEE